MTNLEVKEDGLIYVDGILVSNQEKAKELIIRKGSISRDKDGFYQPIVGVHPIPDLHWTTVDVKIARILSTDGKHKQMPLTGTVAILKESTPSDQQESQHDKSLRLLDEYMATTTPEEKQAVIDKVNKMWAKSEQESQEAIFEVIRYCRRTNLECSAGGYKTMFEYLKRNFTITRKP